MGRPYHTCSLWLWHGFTELQYLDFSFQSSFVSAGYAAFARVHVTISRRLRHGHRMYVTSPSCRFLVGMLTLNQRDGFLNVLLLGYSDEDA
jgi:hypothetical protein